jgi:hypothetical protein
MGANHLDTIDITIILDPAPITGRGFSVLVIADEANGTTLDGDRVRTYTTLAAVQADNTAGFVSAGILATATAMFAQAVQPDKIKIGRKAAVEAYDVALAAIIVVDPDFFGVTIESRAAADQLLVAAPVESGSPIRLFFLQSAEADFLTAGFPAVLSGLDGNERTVIAYHDVATEAYDAAYPANRLAFSPDQFSVNWSQFTLGGVAAYAAAISDTEKANLLANKANPGLPFTTAAQFSPFRGVNANGRAIEEIVTQAWFEDRLTTSIAALVIQQNNLGQKIPVTPVGQGQIGAEVNALFQIGVTAGHFVAGQTEVTYPAITDADRAANLIRVEGRAQLVVSGKVFSVTLNFTRDPIIVE